MNKLKIKDSRFKIQDSNKEFSIFNFQSLIRNNGFSFIELMTVVAIIAVLIAASMPMFRNYTRGKNLKEGTNMIVSALRKTRNAAITERKMYRTVLDTVSHAVAIYLSGDDDNPAENWAKLSEFVKFDTASIDWGVDKFYDEPPLLGPPGPEDSIYYIEFKTSGSTTNAINDQEVLLLETSTDNTKLITVNALTGRIKVEE